MTRLQHRRAVTGLAFVFAVGLLTMPLSQSDAKEQAPPVTFLYQKQIIKGMPDGDFHSESVLTTEQMCTMLCRTFQLDETNSVQACYQNGWIDETALDSGSYPILYQSFYKSVFAAFKIPVYSAELYTDEEIDKTISDVIRVVKQFGFPLDESAFAHITRGEAATAFYRLLTEEFNIPVPDIASRVKIIAPEGLPLNTYLVELNRVPQPILSAFHLDGWSFRIDSEHLADISHGVGSCVGATAYTERAIYVSESQATLHEFGHFLDSQLGFPSGKIGIFAEAKQSGLFLRTYAQTSEREYFAEVFAFWVNSQGNEKARSEFSQACPKTYQYFSDLEKNNWRVG